MSTDAGALLGAEGPFAQALEGFRPRAPQQALARAIQQAIEARGVLLAEAGTGVGKTFAYLVPALISGRRVIVSTGTRNLQDQLFGKDLPRVREALGVQCRIALLKGRANYLCLHRHALAEQEQRWRTPEAAVQLARVREWLAGTRSGDLDELPDLPASAEIRPRITSTVENCLGTECPDYQDCFVVRARREAQEADVVVINHHLFFADMALKEEGFGDLLPSADVVILDEAHQLPEVAGNFFGEQLGSRQLVELERDIIAAQLVEAPDMQSLRDTAAQLRRAMQELRLHMRGERGPRDRLLAQPGVPEALDDLADTLERLEDLLEVAAERGPDLQRCLERVRLAGQRLERFRAGDEDMIAWYQTTRHGFSLNLTPLEVGESFARHRERHACAWILTSATLSVGGEFAHFRERLGLPEDTRAQTFDSPFDFARQALLLVPEGMPDPRDASHVGAVVERALPLIEANEGRCFMLFTSYRALEEAADLLRARGDFELLVQNELARSEMLARFRARERAVLLGTASFWEGVDVRGDDLSLVVIDKLPFASPADPVLQARIAAIRSAGGNPFMDYQVPQAVIALKQGAGRLIRDVDDRGVLMICDPRLYGARYGRVFLDSLPPFRRTRDVAEAVAFLRGLREAVA